MALTYDISKELLFGTVGKHGFHHKAFSGGGRGKKPEFGEGEDTLSSHLSTTQEDEESATRGGPLPPGSYHCQFVADHPKFHECVRLNPESSAKRIASSLARFPFPHHRGGFYIHGRGKKGSDGCIVPESEHIRTQLNKAIKDNPGTVLTAINASYELPAELYVNPIV